MIMKKNSHSPRIPVTKLLSGDNVLNKVHSKKHLPKIVLKIQLDKHTEQSVDEEDLEK